MSEENKPARKRVGADLLIPVVGTLYAGYYVYSVWDFPPEAQRSGFFLAALLVGLCVILFLRTALLHFAGRAEWEFSSLLGPREGRMGRIGFVALIFAYLLVVRHAGFTLTTFAFLFAGSLLGGIGSLRKAAIFAFVTAISGWLFFIVILGTRFPRGPFENLVTMVVATWN
ncbi:tripartite tricarboxylate transporter TctB family protein [Alkalilacustris brevis]|uniref:tripartite tricarboxylate transporter TctB family protein n=1 Tax=Alkalilacustris brevis TaxID=2026338 RepID=UPI000E0D6128|nr:tripartite tricarboxylate transporter TctB family protein [Alkalilacustris brevis]